jgi:hypothetical protein
LVKVESEAVESLVVESETVKSSRTEAEFVESVGSGMGEADGETEAEVDGEVDGETEPEFDGESPILAELDGEGSKELVEPVLSLSIVKAGAGLTSSKTTSAKLASNVNNFRITNVLRPLFN